MVPAAVRSPEVARLFHPPALGVVAVTHELTGRALKLNEDARQMLLRNAPYHELALLQLPLPLGANCRYVQRAGRPAPFREFKLKLPARSFVLVHAAVVAIEQLLEHVSGL